MKMDPSVYTYCHFILSDNVDVKDLAVLKEITDAGFSITHFEPLKIECGNPTIAQINMLSSILRSHIEKIEDGDFSFIGEEHMDCFEEKTSERTCRIADKSIAEKIPLDDCNRPESLVPLRPSDCARSESYDDLSDDFQKLISCPTDDQRQKLCDKFSSENAQICAEIKVKEKPEPLRFTAEQGKQKTVVKSLMSYDEEQGVGELSMQSPITHDTVGLARSLENKVTTSTRAMQDQIPSNYATDQIDEDVSNFRELKNSHGKSEDHGVQEADIKDHLCRESPSLGMKDEENSQCHRYSLFGMKNEQIQPPIEGQNMLSRQSHHETPSSESFAVGIGTRDKSGAGTDKVVTSSDTREKPESGNTNSLPQQGKRQSDCPCDNLTHQEISDSSRVSIYDNLISFSPSTYKYAVRYFGGTILEEFLNQAKNLGSQFMIKRPNYDHHLDLELLQKFCVDNIHYDEEGKDINDALKVLKTSSLIYEIFKGCIVVAGNEDNVKAVKMRLSCPGSQPMMDRCRSEKLSESSRIDCDDGRRIEREGKADRMNAACTPKPKDTDQEFVPPGARLKDKGTVHTSFNQSDWHVETSRGVLSFSNASCATKVTVLKADITKLQVDCIVNAANRKLNHHGGVACAIAAAAGDALQKECNDFISAGNTLDVGEVFVSTGGKLPSRKVIHAVGPRWEMVQPAMRCAKLLKQTVIRCLVEAQSLGMKSVALPSISAAIFKVPWKICAESYLKAAKHFLVSQEVMQVQTLHKIIFVDVAENMVNYIRECFNQHWKLPVNGDEMNEDYEFIKHLLHKQDNITGKEFKQQDTLKQREAYSSVHPSAPADCSVYYKVGSIKIDVSVRHAAACGGDLIILLGEMFDELTGGFSTENQLKRVHPKEIKEFFELWSLHSRFGDALLCKLLPATDTEHNLKYAFSNFREAIELSQMKGGRSVDVKTVVVTGSFLYKDHSNSKKLSGHFGRLFFSEVLQLNKQPTSVERVVIATNKMAKSLITKVLDSREEQGCKKISEAHQLVKGLECIICYEVTENKIRLPCCGNELCIQCHHRVAQCPFCKGIFRVLKDSQPCGSMSWRKNFDMPKSLPQWIAAYEIVYTLHGGIQQQQHPNPGVPYSRAIRRAFLPDTKEGLRVLELLQVAFMRGLIFTIGTSRTSGKEDKIVWNDIHHKTQLIGDYGYPDPSYLQRVTKDLEQKGVTLSSVTSAEAKKLGRQIIQS